MISTIQKQQYYKGLAIHYKGEALLKKCKAAVHLENKSDEIFWKRMFDKYLPSETFHYIFYSRSPKGGEGRGCAQCLAYKNYLDKNFVVCIDSDYRYLLQESDINIHNYIFQTYTYSFENHICKKDGLSEVCKSTCGCKNQIFDFKLFFSHYSKIIHELFIWHISLLKKGENCFTKDDFLKTIDIIDIIKRSSVRKQALDLLIQLDKNVRDKLTELRELFPSYRIEQEKQHFKSLGITERNVYLYIRGHNLHDLLIRMGINVCDEILKDEKEKLKGDEKKIEELYKNRKPLKNVLDNNLLFEAYPEINKIKTDIEIYAQM